MEKNLRRTVCALVSTDQSIRKISRLYGHTRDAVSNFKLIIKEKRITLEQIKSLDDNQLNELFFSRKKYETKKRQPDWDDIILQVKKRIKTKQQAWEEYRLVDPSSAYGRSYFCTLFLEHLNSLDYTMRQIWYGGQTVQVDFAGKRPYWYDRQTGEKRYAELFIATMACSNYTFVLACPSQKLEDWIHAHILMLEFFGGVPEEVIPDNLKSAVTKPGAIPQINETYLDCATHYGFVINPARVGHPQDKGKVENAVLFVTRWITMILRRRKFFSIEEINDAIAPLLERLNRRRFKKLPGNRQEHFEEIDLPLLKGLPSDRYTYGEWVSNQKVGRDYHVRYQNHYYSVPHQYVGEHVRVRVNRKTIEVYLCGKRVAVHILSDVVGGYTTDKVHMPPSHRHYADRSYSYFVEWAMAIGTACVDVVKEQFAGRQEDAPIACKACDKLQTFARTYGCEAFSSACIKALALNSATATTIHNILKSKTYELPDEELFQQQLPYHNNVRGSEYFATGGNPSC